MYQKQNVADEKVVDINSSVTYYGMYHWHQKKTRKKEENNREPAKRMEKKGNVIML